MKTRAKEKHKVVAQANFCAGRFSLFAWCNPNPGAEVTTIACFSVQERQRATSWIIQALVQEMHQAAVVTIERRLQTTKATRWSPPKEDANQNLIEHRITCRHFHQQNILWKTWKICVSKYSLENEN